MTRGRPVIDSTRVVLLPLCLSSVTDCLHRSLEEPMSCPNPSDIWHT